jgi:hypothetical protein
MSESRKPLALAVGRCAALVLPYTYDNAAHSAIALVLQYGAGVKISMDALQIALGNVMTAINVYRYHTEPVSDYLRIANYVAVDAIAAVSSGATRAGSFASTAAKATSRQLGYSVGEILSKYADIIREIYPAPPVVQPNTFV